MLHRLVTFLLGLAVLAGLAIPASYLILANDLPPLSTRDEVIHTLKIFVEGQRQRALAGTVGARVQGLEKFEPLAPSDLPAGILAGALTTEGCPDYFTGEKEVGFTWFSRVIGAAIGNHRGLPGPGQCEWKYADRLADALGLPSDAHRAIAIHEMHEALSKQDLLDFELSSRYFGPGVLGVASASKRLFGKPVKDLDLADSAELLLAEGNFDQINSCKDPNKILIFRNNILNGMAAFKLVKQADIDRAKQKVLHCLSRPG